MRNYIEDILRDCDCCDKLKANIKNILTEIRLESFLEDLELLEEICFTANFSICKRLEVPILEYFVVPEEYRIEDISTIYDVLPIIRRVCDEANHYESARLFDLTSRYIKKIIIKNFPNNKKYHYEYEYLVK